MTTRTAAAAVAAVLLGLNAHAAAAETLDAKTFSCKELTEANASSSESDQYGASVLFYWMSGYLATEEQGTVVDFDALTKAYEQTSAYCEENPAVSVLSASQQYLGENQEASGGELIDVSLLKCEKVTQSSKEDAQGMGQILMWFVGHHASDEEDTIIDFSKFDVDTRKIGEYCSANPQIGFYTASEQFMGREE